MVGGWRRLSSASSVSSRSGGPPSDSSWDFTSSSLLSRMANSENASFASSPGHNNIRSPGGSISGRSHPGSVSSGSSARSHRQRSADGERRVGAYDQKLRVRGGGWPRLSSASSISSGSGGPPSGSSWESTSSSLRRGLANSENASLASSPGHNNIRSVPEASSAQGSSRGSPGGSISGSVASGSSVRHHRQNGRDGGRRGPPAQPTRKNVFDDDSDEDDGPEWMKSKTSKNSQKSRSMQENQAKQVMKKALEDDPTVYQYDEVYDEMEEKKIQTRIRLKGDEKPKYNDNLLKASERRKLENEQRIERQVQKEREEEGDEFKDKEIRTFVTGAYRKKMEEQQVLLEEARRKDMIDGELSNYKEKSHRDRGHRKRRRISRSRSRDRAT